MLWELGLNPLWRPSGVLENALIPWKLEKLEYLSTNYNKVSLGMSNFSIFRLPCSLGTEEICQTEDQKQIQALVMRNYQGAQGVSTKATCDLEVDE